MKKYKVLKEFVSSDTFALYQIGDRYNPPAHTDYDEILVTFGFIEEVKEDNRWIPKLGETYYTVNGDCEAYPLTRVSNRALGDNYEKNNNMYRSREAAEKVADALKLFFKYLHTDEGYQDIRLYDVALDARKAVLADDKRGSDE